MLFCSGVCCILLINLDLVPFAIFSSDLSENEVAFWLSHFNVLFLQRSRMSHAQYYKDIIITHGFSFVVTHYVPSLSRQLYHIMIK